MGTLYLVATPIGNLEDISARALRTLKEVILIAAEDTRRTRKLLNHYDIHTPLTSYFEHNKLKKLEKIKSALTEGNVALVSDAGTPVLNDPGYELVLAVINEGHEVSPIPGPCAPIAALTASGLPTDKFLYLGYLPRKPGQRQSLLSDIESMPHSIVFFESPNRLVDSLEDIERILGDRQVAVARELTKIYEDIFRGSLSEAITYYSAQTPRGEITLVLAGKTRAKEIWSDDRIQREIESLLSDGEPPSIIATRLAGQSGISRRELYDRIITLKRGEDT